MYKSITISSGHGKYVPGAVGFIDEVTEARKVVNKVAEYLKQIGVSVTVIHDDTSKTKAQNITNGKSSYLVSKHNASSREVDISVHFNAASKTSSPRGTEVLYYDAKSNAAKLSAAIAKAGNLKDRGAKERKDLSFLANTNKPALLIEVCFVDSSADVDAYKKNFDNVCRTIAETLTGKAIPKATSSSHIGVVEIIADELNLRDLPNTNGKIIRVLKKGERYKAYKKDPNTGWYNLGGNQWCSGGSSYVKFTQN